MAITIRPAQRSYGFGFGPSAQQLVAASREARERQAALDERNAPGQERIDTARREVFGRSQRRAEELRSDPNDAAVMAYLTSVMQGQNQPVSAITQAQLTSQATDQNAAAEAARAQAFRDRYTAGGGSTSDAGYAAMMDRLMAERQGANVRDARDIAIRSSAANQGASMDAALNLAGVNARRNQGITNAENQVVNLYSQETAPIYTPPQSSYAQKPQRRGSTGFMS